MPLPNELEAILSRIETRSHTAEDIATMRQLLSDGSYQVIQQLDGKYNIHIGQGQDIHIGDRRSCRLG